MSGACLVKELLFILGTHMIYQDRMEYSRSTPGRVPDCIATPGQEHLCQLFAQIRKEVCRQCNQRGRGGSSNWCRRLSGGRRGSARGALGLRW